MAHQPTLDALAAARYWLEAHPDLPTPHIDVPAFDSDPRVELRWHYTKTAGSHVQALTVLRAFADWPWEARQIGDGSVTAYKLERDGFALVVFADTLPAVTAPVNLLDALAEVA